MHKLKSSLTNMVVVLTVLAVAVGVGLAAVHNLTTPVIAGKADRQLTQGISNVMGQNNVQVTSTDTVTSTENGKPDVIVMHHIKGGGVAVEAAQNGFGGTLRVLVGFNAQGSITGYTILESAETPGLGQKAATWFAKGGKGCVIGLKPGATGLSVTKDGGKVDAITASTITSRAFLNAINKAYRAAFKQEPDAESGASVQTGASEKHTPEK